MRPIVYLIGTGPGDPGLISARGARCLAAADVVLYDHLVHPRLLRYPRQEAEKIDLGSASPQTLDQEAINYLLVEKAREGKIVARLKWGDPFLFDRGGQEALFLHEHGIPFEVVPGIPAAIGTTSYAGVPLTYPGGGDSVTFVRGHEDESSTAPNVDWASLARLGGTLVCYTGTLQELVEMKNLRTKPAILVVGRVVGLRQHLRWFDERPLFGKKIVVTRSREQAGELVDMLESLGAEPIEAPMIRVEAPDDYGPLDAATAEAGTYDWIVFTSANGVDFFMRRLMASGDIRDLKGVKIVAIGPATSDRLARHGLRVDLEPAESRAEAIVQSLREMGDIKGKRFLLPRADIAREVLPEELRKSGADVTEVTAYRTVLAEIEREGDPDIYRMLLEKRIDVVTFTSASTVKNFVQIFGAEQAPDLLNATKVASIGPVTAEAAEQYGIRTAIMPKEYTVTALVEAIVDHFRQENKPS